MTSCGGANVRNTSAFAPINSDGGAAGCPTVTRVTAAADGSDVDQRVDGGMLKLVASSRGRLRR